MPTQVDKGFMTALIAVVSILVISWVAKYTQPEFERIRSEALALVGQMIGRACK